MQLSSCLLGVHWQAHVVCLELISGMDKEKEVARLACLCTVVAKEASSHHQPLYAY